MGPRSRCHASSGQRPMGDHGPPAARPRRAVGSTELSEMLVRLVDDRLLAHHGIDRARDAAGSGPASLPGAARCRRRAAPSARELARPRSHRRRHRGPVSDTRSAHAVDIATASRLAAEVLDEVNRAVVGKREALTLVLCGRPRRRSTCCSKIARTRQDARGTLVRADARAHVHAGAVHSDLLPADLTGSFVYDQRTQEFVFPRGDRCSRACCGRRITARRQDAGALLEAMQEHQITVEGVHVRARRPVPRARNGEPGRVRGHVPAPEAQLDRLCCGSRSATRRPKKSGRSSPAASSGAARHTSCARCRRADVAGNAGSGRGRDRRRRCRPLLRRARGSDREHEHT